MAMHGYRFSLRWLFAVVSFAAVGCGLLVYATPFTSSLVFTVALLVLMTAALAAALYSGQRRAFRAGFAGFGLAYLWLSCSSGVMPPGHLRDWLVTTRILAWCYERTPRTRSVVPLPGGMGGPGIMAGGVGGPGMMPGMQGMAVAPAPIAVRPDWPEFAAAGHSLFALLVGALGGVLAVRFHRKAASASSYEPEVQV